MNSLNFKTIAIGDSLNDLGMLEEADVGVLFKSSNAIKSKYSQYFSCDAYDELLIKIHQTFNK
jgi:phosphoserine/homoserine phosphotransferase